MDEERFDDRNYKICYNCSVDGHNNCSGKGRGDEEAYDYDGKCQCACVGDLTADERFKLRKLINLV